MAEEKKTSTKPRKPKSQLIGNQAKPVILDSTTKLDIDTDKKFVDNIIEAGLSQQLDISALDGFTNISNARDQIYQLIDTMCQDSAVSSIVRTYTEDVCEMADNGHIMWCESNDPNISKFVNYLLNVMNVDKNIFGWTYSLIKYGDAYLRLYRESDYKDPIFKTDSIKKAYSARNVLNENAKQALNEGVNLSIHFADDPYSFYIELVPDPSTMFELTKYGISYGYVETPNVPAGFNTADSFTATTGLNTYAYNYKMKSGDVNVYQADDFVHACLQDNVSRYPETVDLFTTEEDYNSGNNGYSYTVRRGKSMLYDSYKTWREKQLLEAAILLNRITRSSIVRKVAVEVGDMPKEQVQQTLRRVKELFEQKTAMNTGTSMTEYTNPGAVENFIYYATHNGQGAITVDSVGGDVNVKDLADLDNWVNKFYANYGIPKQYFGYTDDGAGFNGGTSLTILSSVYSKGVKRIQNAMIQAVTDAINLILVNKGCKSYLNNFVLKMKAPLSQEELDFRENFSNRVQAISSVTSLFTDIEDKTRRLGILKDLVRTLNFGDNVLQIIEEEIKETKEKQKEEEAKAEAEAAGGDGDLDLSASDDLDSDADTGSEDLDLAPMPDEAIDDNSSNEGFVSNGGSTQLVEGPDLLTEDDLPSPEDINGDIDFSENK